AKRISAAGVICLIIGFFVNLMSLNDPSLSRLSLGLLAVGGFSAFITSGLVNSWIREPRADQFLSEMLKQFSGEYMLFNYTVSTSNIILTPTRLYLVVVKNLDGEITVEGDKFKKPLTWRKILRLFATDGLGNPVKEAKKGILELNELLAENLPEQSIPEIEALVVFSSKYLELKVNNPVLPVLHNKEIRTYLKKHNREKRISKTERQELANIIGGQYSEF
ncbi:nuclease-related domain-containing protein, partial [Anaerolineales bacterium HSG24]|nr:nuclease-related domain-containing protein [Anaerolineales bacterium HSG24]